MMMIDWVAIGARTASKLSPPCLKGNALPILKTLKLWLQVGDAATVNKQGSAQHSGGRSGANQMSEGSESYSQFLSLY